MLTRGQGKATSDPFQTIIRCDNPLIYVGLQVRQNTRAMRSETRLGLAGFMYRNHTEAALSSDMSGIVLKSLTDPQSMNDLERQRWIFWYEGFFHMLEGYYHEYQEGQLSKEFMERFDGWIAGMLKENYFHLWWESERMQNRFTNSFLDYVDGLIANPPEKSWQWRDSTDVFNAPR